MRLFNVLIAGVIFCAVTGCASPADTQLSDGVWRGELSRDGQKLPLLLEIARNPDGKTYMVHSLNADEKIRFDTAYFANDSLHIPMQLFDSEIVAQLKEGKLSGSYNRLKEGTVEASLPFQATFGQNYRFFREGEASTAKSVAGKWSTLFINKATGDSTNAVGTFTQKGSDVEGSFLTPTGDYRYLSGSLEGDSLFLSTFDGDNAKLFKAALKPDGSLEGALWSGVKGYRTWTAKPDPNAKLPDPSTLTYLKPGADRVSFSFRDADGQTVSLSDQRFQNKVVVIQILGSWCPNCMDETNFLSPWYKKNRNRGVEIVGLAFEHSDRPEVSGPKLKRMISRYAIDYPILLAGTNTAEATAKALPMLNKVMSYPTTIIVDKKGKVREIHTGFSGPGTGAYYTEYVEKFNGLIDKLVAEQ